MLTRIHVNQHVIRTNRKKSEDNPPLTVKDYKQNRKAHEANIVVDGKVVAKVVYRPDAPLPCGAHCWVETTEEVSIQ